MSAAPPGKAIILAAGQGKRLGALTQHLPKCLLQVGGRTILEHQVATLRACGVSSFVVLTGFGADHVRAVLGSQARYIHNARYESTNSLYSFYLARAETAGGFILLNGDVLFHCQIAESLLQSPYADAAAVDFRDGLGEEETKVKVQADRIVAITKDMDPRLSDGENVGLLKFTGSGAQRLVRKAEELLQAGAERAWVIAAFHALAPEHPIYAVTTGRLPWIEVDFVEDLRRARHQIAPRCRLSK